MNKLVKNKKKSFTLIELIIVIAILALLIAIALPRYQNSREQAAITAHNANVKILKTATQQFLADSTSEEISKISTNPINLNFLSPYLESIPKVPKGVPNVNQDTYTITINTENSPYTVEVKPNEQ